MGFITKTQVKRAISLGSLNPKIIDPFFHDIKYRSYDYDYLIQDQLIDVYTQRNDFKNEVFNNTELMLDGVADGSRDTVCILSVDKSIVHNMKRKTFRHYSFYNKPITQEAMMQRRDIFKYGILTFINGVLEMGFRVQPKDDKTYLLFPYKDYASTVKDGDVISTLFLPESVVTTSRALVYTDKIGTKRLKGEVFTNIDHKYLEECSGFMAFFIKRNTRYRPVFYTGITYDSEQNEFIFESMPSSVEGYYVVMVGMESYKETITVTANTKYFQIPRRNMPVPADNLIVMVQDPNGYSYSINTGEITITECYPYVYKVDNPTGKAFKVLVLYTNKGANELIEYDSEIDYYLDMVNLIERYRLDTVPDLIKDYKPIKWDYLIRDYQENIGVPTPTSDPWYPLLYKLNKINTIYKLWCLFLQTFIRRTYGFLENWLLDVSTIDLSTRSRTSTMPEIPMTDKHYKPFSKPLYLFRYKSLSNTDEPTTYGWFIDGSFVVPEYTANYDGYMYAYFDPDTIKADSLIEIERYDGNYWSKKITVDVITTITVNWLERPVLMNAIFITDKDGNYMTSGQYKISVQDPRLSDEWFDIDLVNSVFILENGMNLRIEGTDERYIHSTVYLNCNNIARVWNFDTTQLPNFSGYNLNKYGQVDRCKQNILQRIRIYSPDGRMYPRYAYTETSRTNINEPPSFQVYSDTSKGAPFRIQYLGYDERIVYQQDMIPEKGIINLEGKIRRPFSLTYHTVFLDGYKLNEKNIVQISPFTIAIQNVTYARDLVIYERIHGDEMFDFAIGDGVRSSYVADRLLAEDPEYYAQVLNGLSKIVIDPTIPDMDDEIDILMAIIKREIAVKFINMDDIHTDEDWGYYALLFEDDWRVFLNADERIEKHMPIFNWFYVNHDYTIENT